ncbi:MAG: CopG family transcriptional regulator [Gammaproteobacteria bacterium]|jgi:antitoxin ParD1/3/4|nr:CopG family transcriptional regulator [Gammaproteobacteria bacterium]
MTRQSISLTPPNDKWLKTQIDSEEYTSKSEVVNDLIRKARKIEEIQTRLIHAEQSGFITQSRDEILAEIKEEMRKNGNL